MRTILYVVLAFALSSCAGHNFMKQKYTHFAHSKNQSKHSKTTSSKEEPANKVPAEEKQLPEERQAVVLPPKKNAEGTSLVPVFSSLQKGKKKLPEKAQVAERQKTLVKAASGSTIQQKSTTSAPRHFPRMTAFEEFILAFILIFIFVFLPAAFLTGLVWMFFNLWLGVLIAGSALFIFGLILFLALVVS